MNPHTNMLLGAVLAALTVFLVTLATVRLIRWIVRSMLALPLPRRQSWFRRRSRGLEAESTGRAGGTQPKAGQPGDGDPEKSGKPGSGTPEEPEEPGNGTLEKPKQPGSSTPGKPAGATAAGSGRPSAPGPSLLGTDPRTRLLGLAAACLIFAPLVSRLVRVTVQMGALLMERLPHGLTLTWRQQTDLCARVPGAECVEGTWLVLLRTVGRAFGSAVRDSGLPQVQFGLVVFFVALWVLATALLNAAAQPDEKGEPELDLTDILLKEEHWVTRQNFLFFLILFIGTYLSVASIAAIPDLSAAEGSTPTSLSSTNFDEKLQSMQKKAVGTRSELQPDPLQQARGILLPIRLSDSAAAARADTPTAAAPATGTSGQGTGSGNGNESGSGSGNVVVDANGQAGNVITPANRDVRPSAAAEIAKALKGTASGSGNQAQRPVPVAYVLPPAMRPHADSLRPVLVMLSSFWNDQLVRNDSLHRELGRVSAYSRDLATNAYMNVDSTRRLREQRSYFDRLQRWFLLTTNDLQRESDKAWVTLVRLDRRMQAWSADAASYLTGGTAEPARLKQLQLDAVRLRYDALLALEDPVIPMRELPQRGGGLGVFRWVSGWLLQTDSLPLTMIVGMLGFGLLGAAASTFVREQTLREREEAAKREELYQLRQMQREQGLMVETETEERLRPEQPLVLNLPSVVIRGGSAAIVVFLGIMGGLSVFTSDAAPNPYALLFTCLVGAVFSQKVWDWAEKRFGDGDGGLFKGGPRPPPASTTTTTTTTTTPGTTGTGTSGTSTSGTGTTGTGTSGTGTSGTGTSGTGTSGTGTSGTGTSGTGTSGTGTSGTGTTGTGTSGTGTSGTGTSGTGTSGTGTSGTGTSGTGTASGVAGDATGGTGGTVTPGSDGTPGGTTPQHPVHDPNAQG